jgi:lipopolysaccharide export system protein LptA
MNTLAIQLLLAVTCAVSGAVVRAEKADNNKPMNIESDVLRYDDLKQTSVFSGRVVLTKGSIVIRGGMVEVRQDPQGYQFGVVTAEPGQLAFFRQKREGVDEFIEGEGETIEYDGRSDTVKFLKNAQMRRLRGATLADEVTGSIIHYNSSTDVFTVDGGVARGPADKSRGRVRVVLTPKPQADASSAPLTGTPLRSSTTLGGERQ